MSENTNKKIFSTIENSWKTLTKLPHFLYAQPGQKIKGGKETGQLGIIVFVDEKVSKNLLAPQDMVPPFLENIVTDVQELKPKTWKPHKSRFSPEETKKRLGIIKTGNTKTNVATVKTEAAGIEVPSGKADWTIWEQESGVEDQGSCASCSKFAIKKVWQSMLRIQANNPNLHCTLSAKMFHACSGGTCKYGDSMENSFLQAEKGVCTEECCPYNNMIHGAEHLCGEDRCVDWEKTVKKIVGVNKLTDPINMKLALDKHPLASTLTVYADFTSYVETEETETYQHATSWILGYHAIEIVGYDDKREAWKISNSWDWEWGYNFLNPKFNQITPSGYGWIKYGDSNIDNEMYELILPEIQPEPTPEQNIFFLKKLLRWIRKIMKKPHSR